MTDVTTARFSPVARSPVNLPFLDKAAPSSPPTVAAAETDGKPAAERTPQQKRRSLLKWSSVLVILLPTLLAGLYYGLIASDQYAVEVRFAVRGAQQAPSSDLLGMFVNTAVSGTTATDSYIVMDFIRSRELIDKLEQDINIRKIYSSEKADFLSRLPPKAPIEDVQDYWKRMIEVGFDTASQIVVFKVRAFSQVEAKALADAIVQHSETLINELSVRARNDAIQFARTEVDNSETRLKSVRGELRQFRDQRQEVDPIKTAEAQLTQNARIEGELAEAKAQLKTLSNFMQQDAPNVAFLKTKIRSLEQQLVQERLKVGKGPDGSELDPTLSRALADFEKMQVELEFAQKAYVTALAAMERARLEALQKQRYLAVFVTPKLPELSEYPKRVTATLTVFGASIVLWAMGVLIFYAIRDHTT